MMLARAMARQREIGIRLTLGAVRARLIRQLLTESILLSVPAAILGFAASQITIEAALRGMFATIPRDMLELIRDVPLPLDWRVFGFMMLAALTSAFLFGLAPAIQATRGGLMIAAQGEFSSDVRPVRIRNGLVIAQITVCTLLLIACGALVRTTARVGAFDIGFHTRRVIAINIAESGRTRVLEALGSDRRLDGIAAASSVPLGGLLPSVTASAPNGAAINAAYNYVSPQYFSILGIPIIRGRDFAPPETVSGMPAAILSAAAARRLFAGADPLGQVVHITGKPAADVQVIGVAEDVVTCCIAYGKDAALIYLPTTPATAQRSLLVRVRGDVEAERRRLDTELGARVPGTVDDIHSLDQYLAVSIYPFRAARLVGFAVGGLALLLTVSGIYGVLSYLVTQRTKEIGIRVALGATTGMVTGLVLKQSLRLAAIGIGLGVSLALVLSRLLGSKLLFLRVFDPPAFSAGALLVALAAIAAGYVPSRRAARIDPIKTLRYD
jgi:predicted permease